jgi:hypothetical protein
MKITNQEKQRISKLYNQKVDLNEIQLSEFYSRTMKLLNEQQPTYSWDTGGVEPPKGTTTQIQSSQKFNVSDKTYYENLDEVVEMLREAVYSPVGVGVEIVVSFFGPGKIAVASIYGFLLAYDVYKMMNGDNTSDRWFNIFIDTMGVTLSGALTPILVGLRNAAKTTKLSSIIDVLNWLKGTKAWTKISEFLVSIKNGISKVVDVVGPSVKYFADLPIFVIKKMSQGIIGGIQAILSGIGKIFGFINNSIVKPIYTFIENLTSKGLQKLGTPEKYAKPLSKGVSGWGTVFTLDKMLGTSTLDDENVQPSQRK